MFITLIIYSVAILWLWFLFLISRVHSYKFKNYSSIIAPVTRFIAIIFIVLTIAWYLFIFIWLNNDDSSSSYWKDKLNNEQINVTKDKSKNKKIEAIEETSVDNDFDIIY